jgi:hypothetical protein
MMQRLTDYQEQILRHYGQRLTPAQRDTFLQAVKNRLGTQPTDAAVNLVAQTVRAEIGRHDKHAVRKASEHG